MTTISGYKVFKNRSFWLPSYRSFLQPKIYYARKGNTYNNKKSKKDKKNAFLKLNAQTKFCATDGNWTQDPLHIGQIFYLLRYRDSHVGTSHGLTIHIRTQLLTLLTPPPLPCEALQLYNQVPNFQIESI